MRYAGRTFNKKLLARAYRGVSTKVFADANGLSLNQARRLAAINGWRKDEATLRQLLRLNAESRWEKRIVCATDHNGLSHAVAAPYDTFSLLSSGAFLRMRCGARFKPIATRQKDFPACSKCLAALASLRDKRVAPPVETSTLRKRCVQKHILIK